ncbi:MAG: class I SAM-dependent methyltransferase [Patescibacteria group bacterium]|nr:class I SAM-dependent methyltransferase [Patescibacteria group bacterium]
MSTFYEKYWKDKEILEDFHYKWLKIKQFIPKERGISLLDFGCGKGSVLEEILKLNPTLKTTGVDVSKQAIKYIKNRIPKQRFLAISEGKKLPFKTDSFDFITALDVLEHVYDTELVFSELARILKPGGKILITVPYYGLIKNLIITLFSFNFVYTPRTPHIRFYTKRSLLQEIKSAGLNPEKFGYYGRFYPIPRGMFCLAHK